MSKGKIGITCTTVFHYIHFHRIAEQLTNLGYEVEYVIYTPYYINNRVERLVEMFEQVNVPYCGFEDLFMNECRFNMLLAPYYMPGFQLIDKRVKKVRLLYGYAKDRWNYAEWNKGFDLVLSYGDYATNRMKEYTNVVNIGHPRQKLEYADSLTDIKEQVISKEIFKDEKVLLYCPTWADLSSLQIFMDNVASLASEYKVIVKLHHGNVLSGNNELWVSLTNQKNVYLFDEYTDLFDLLQFAGIVLSDYSGAIFDAMLFKIPIVLLDVIDESIRDTGAINLEKMQDISIYKETSNNSVSLDIKIREIMPHVRFIDELQPTLRKAHSEKIIPYEHLLEELYAYQDDKAPTRAAKKISELIQSEKIHFDNNDSFHILDELKIEAFLQGKVDDSIKVWGAGLSGQILLAWLQSKGTIIDYVIDIDDNKTNKDIFGLKISKPVFEKNILISVPGQAYLEIRAQLIEHGLIEGIHFISIFKGMTV